MRVRLYQDRFVSECIESLRAGVATLGVAPTGAGKTFMGARIAEEYRSVVIVAHRREILDQWRKETVPHSSLRVR